MVIIKLNYNKYTTKHTHSWHTHTDSENRATFRVLSVIDFVVFLAVVGLPAQLLCLCNCAYDYYCNNCWATSNALLFDAFNDFSLQNEENYAPCSPLWLWLWLIVVR